MALVRPTRGEVLRPGGLAGGGAPAVYEALTDWIDLSQPIKDAWDAGPDNDPGSYHPDNAGDWTLTRTAGTPGTLTLAGTTGSTVRDGWSEWVRFDVGSLATLMGVTGAALAASDVVLMFRATLAGLGTRNGTQPLVLIQGSTAATPPTSASQVGGAGLRWWSDALTSGLSGAASSSKSVISGVTGSISSGGVALVRVERTATTGGYIRQSAYLIDNAGDGLGGRSTTGGSSDAVTADSRLWFGAGQDNATAAAFTGFECSFEARLLKRNAVPWDPDFGL